MGFLDALKSAAGEMGDQEAHQAFDGVLQNTPLGGMSGLLGQLQQGGLGEQVTSWCQGAAANVSPDQIRSALGDEHVQAIASSLGISTDDVANHLAEHLPDMAQAHAANQG
jgi:uncharacterized protein YidB (DUF937 family)